MIKFCKYGWDLNKDKLKKAIKDKGDDFLDNCNYLDLMQLIVTEIFNNTPNSKEYTWNAEDITVIDNGDYQGTILFMIPADTYQPGAHEYLLTFIEYGSCSGCDTILNIQEVEDDPESKIKDYMVLCKDMVCNTIRPFNNGWRESDEFCEVEC